MASRGPSGCRAAFEARLDGRQLCISRQPLLDGASALLADGIDPETPIVTRHAGDDFDAMRSTIGEAAKWTVQENEKVGPRFVRWDAISRGVGSAGGITMWRPSRLPERRLALTLW